MPAKRVIQPWETDGYAKAVRNARTATHPASLEKAKTKGLGEWLSPSPAFAKVQLSSNGKKSKPSLPSNPILRIKVWHESSFWNVRVPRKDNADPDIYSFRHWPTAIAFATGVATYDNRGKTLPGLPVRVGKQRKDRAVDDTTEWGTRLRKELIAMGIKQAEVGGADIEDIAIKTMQAMTTAYHQVTEMMNVMSGGGADTLGNNDRKIKNYVEGLSKRDTPIRIIDDRKRTGGSKEKKGKR